jgi:hypothetical protein
MRSSAGQATTETMLLVSVIVVAVVAVAWLLAEPFIPAMEKLGEQAETVYASGDLAH